MSVLSFVSVGLLVVLGVYLTVKSGCFQFKRLGLVFSVTIGKLLKSKNLSGFKAMAIALGSTIGIGNIIGVSAAIIVGGPGAVFWMLVTGFLGMIIKFAEVYICVDDAKRSNRISGGPMYVIKEKGRGLFKYFCYTFAVVTVLASFFAGNVIQSKSIYNFAELGFDVGFLPVTLLMLPILFVILIGKDKLYQNVAAVLVPLMSLFYVVSVLIIIFQNFGNIPKALLMIFESAFGFEEISGGFSGAIISSALKQGVMKGLFTHEAGMGSSPIAHSSSNEKDPFCQGCWGIVEVFVDTVVVCMLTALAVLTSPIFHNAEYSDAFKLICDIFTHTFGSFGIKSLSVSAILFAFASIVGWSFYGIKSLEFLTSDAMHKKTYICLFLLFVPFSCVIKNRLAWDFCDLFNSLMLIINSGLLFCFGKGAVSELSRIKKVLK